MAEFTVNAKRVDPYKTFKFRVKWDGVYVAGISKVGALKRTTEVVKHRDGGDPSTSHKSPGRNEYEAITLERGVTHDLAFQQWANRSGITRTRKPSPPTRKCRSPTSART
jgi:phage tail-like protein